MSYFIKKVGHQELGYANRNANIPGTSRGQYLLISKQYLDYFPKLSKKVLNDMQILNFVGPKNKVPVQVKYVYNNDLYHNSTANNPRDEHRINLNLKLNIDRKIFLKDDIIILKKEIFKNEDLNDERSYIVSIVRAEEIYDDYTYLDNLIARKKINYTSRNYAQVEKDDLLGLKDNKLKNRLFKRVLSDGIIIPEVDSNLYSDIKNLDSRTGESQIKRLIFDKYNNQCLISNIGYTWISNGEEKTYIQGIIGAHIRPRCQSGVYNDTNIIPLIDPIHHIFDKGIFTFDEDMRIEIHRDAMNDKNLQNFHHYNGKKLKIPEGISIDSDNINHHREHVFGNFLTGRAIRSF